jgi:hypothetical protein
MGGGQIQLIGVLGLAANIVAKLAMPPEIVGATPTTWRQDGKPTKPGWLYKPSSLPQNPQQSPGPQDPSGDKQLPNAITPTSKALKAEGARGRARGRVINTLALKL